MIIWRICTEAACGNQRHRQDVDSRGKIWWGWICKIILYYGDECRSKVVWCNDREELVFVQFGPIMVFLNWFYLAFKGRFGFVNLFLFGFRGGHQCQLLGFDLHSPVTPILDSPSDSSASASTAAMLPISPVARWNAHDWDWILGITLNMSTSSNKDKYHTCLHLSIAVQCGLRLVVEGISDCWSKWSWCGFLSFSRVVLPGCILYD